MNPITRLGLWLGVCSAGIYIIFFLGLYWRYQNPYIATPKSLDFFIYVLAMVTGSYLLRFRVQSGVLRFWQGAAVNSLIFGITLLISVLFMASFLQYAPQTLDRYKQYQIQNFKQNKPTYLQAMKLEQAQEKEQKFAQMVQALDNLPPQKWFWHILQKEIIEKIILGIFLIFMISALFRT